MSKIKFLNECPQGYLLIAAVVIGERNYYWPSFAFSTIQRIKIVLGRCRFLLFGERKASGLEI